ANFIKKEKAGGEQVVAFYVFAVHPPRGSTASPRGRNETMVRGFGDLRGSSGTAATTSMTASDRKAITDHTKGRKTMTTKPEHVKNGKRPARSCYDASRNIPGWPTSSPGSAESCRGCRSKRSTGSQPTRACGPWRNSSTDARSS